MAKESTFGNMVLSLTVICLVCSALLGVVYSVTKAPIEAVDVAKVNNAIAAVTPSFDNVPSEEMFLVGENEVYPAKVGGQIAGYAIKVKSSGFGGAIQMMVGFTADGKIYNTSVISHSETPGLGAKITDENSSPRAQVMGKDIETTDFTVSKDGGDIDAITASTITSRAFLKGVNAACDIFRQIAPSEEQTASETEVETNNTTEDEQ